MPFTTLDLSKQSGSSLPSSITSASGLTLGISEVDMWRLTSSFNGDAEPIASNWERVDTAGFAKIGTGWTESSGIFTAPSTGIYEITFILGTYIDGDNPYADARIQTTSNNSSYAVASASWNGAGQASSTLTYSTSVSKCIFDITSTSTHKVRFDSRVGNNSTGTWGETGENHTSALFVKLGDT